MDILFLDTNFETIGVIDLYESLQWRRVYTDVGDFALYVAPECEQIVKDATYMYLADDKELALVENVELSETRLIVRGRFYDAVYDWELVYPTEDFYNKYPEEIIYYLLGKYYPSVKTPSTTQNLGEKITTQMTGDTVLEVIKNICAAQQLGFYTTLDSSDNSLHFQLYAGKNRLPSQSENTFVSFSDGFGTIQGYKYEHNIKNVRNYALVAGQGEGSERVVVVVDHTDGERRKMLWVDARDLQQDDDTSDAQYWEMLKQRGEEKLASYQEIQTIEVTPVLDNLIYQTDYDVGDICAVEILHKNEDTQETVFRLDISKRISEITEVYEDNSLQLKIVLGEQYPTVDQAIKVSGSYR